MPKTCKVSVTLPVLAACSSTRRRRWWTISVGVTVIGSLVSLVGATGSITGLTNWSTCNLTPRTGRARHSGLTS